MGEGRGRGTSNVQATLQQCGSKMCRLRTSSKQSYNLEFFELMNNYWLGCDTIWSGRQVLTFVGIFCLLEGAGREIALKHSYLYIKLLCHISRHRDWEQIFLNVPWIGTFINSDKNKMNFINIVFGKMQENGQCEIWGIHSVVLLRIQVFGGVMLCHWVSGSQCF